MITIFEASAADFKDIQEIAYQTWPHTYGEILQKVQIDYMLDLFYSDAMLAQNISEKQHQFLIAKADNRALGFASYQHHYNEETTTYIHKIYILPQTQGKGIGKLLIDFIENLAKENHSTVLALNVNRFNKALTFYQKIGFEIASEETIFLEHGYLMEDYKMKKML